MASLKFCPWQVYSIRSTWHDVAIIRRTRGSDVLELQFQPVISVLLSDGGDGDPIVPHHTETVLSLSRRRGHSIGMYQSVFGEVVRRDTFPLFLIDAHENKTSQKEPNMSDGCAQNDTFW